MLKAVGRFLEKWGHYLLAAACVSVILLSGLWTRAQQAREAPGAQALSDTAQRLADVTTAPAAFIPLRPCEGDILRPYSETPVYFESLGIWQIHPGVDFALPEGEAVRSVADGTVEQVLPILRIDHGNGYASEYRGLAAVAVSPGQTVGSGQILGTAGSQVAFEGTGHVCVRLLRNGAPIPPGGDWLTK